MPACGVVIERRNHQIGRCWKRLGGLMTGWMSGNRAWKVELAEPGSLTSTVLCASMPVCLAVRQAQDMQHTGISLHTPHS